MYTFDLARPYAPEHEWRRLSALRSLRHAQSALDDAGAMLSALLPDTEWHSDGVRALHEEILAFRDRCGTERAALQSMIWPLEVIG